jgi:hypothetical protein
MKSRRDRSHLTLENRHPTGACEAFSGPAANKKGMNRVRRTYPEAELPYRRASWYSSANASRRSTGGRIFVVLILVIARHFGCRIRRPGRTVGGRRAIGLLLVFARHPASPGLSVRSPISSRNEPALNETPTLNDN